MLLLVHFYNLLHTHNVHLSDSTGFVLSLAFLFPALKHRDIRFRYTEQPTIWNRPARDFLFCFYNTCCKRTNLQRSERRKKSEEYFSPWVFCWKFIRAALKRKGEKKMSGYIGRHTYCEELHKTKKKRSTKCRWWWKSTWSEKISNETRSWTKKTNDLQGYIHVECSRKEKRN